MQSSSTPQGPAGYYCQATVPYPSQLQPLDPLQAHALLSRAAQAAHQLSFQWRIWQRPVPGSMMLILQLGGSAATAALAQQQSSGMPASIQSDRLLADDGYGWLRDAPMQRVPLPNNKALDMWLYDSGFVPGEQTTSMSKRRYRLSGMGAEAASSLQLIHYLPLSTPAQPVTGPGLSFVKPVPFAQRAPPRSSPLLTANKSPHSKSKRPALTAPPLPTGAHAPPAVSLHERDLSGDEMDLYSARDVAQARYQRNHEYMHEILSGVTVQQLWTHSHRPPSKANVTDPVAYHQKQKQTQQRHFTQLENQIKVLEKENEMLEEKMKRQRQDLEQASQQWLDSLGAESYVRDNLATLL